MRFYIVLDICDKSAWSKRLTRFLPGISDYSCLFHLRGKTESVRENCVSGRLWVDCLLDHITWLFEFQFKFDGKNGFFAVTVRPMNWFQYLKKHLDRSFGEEKQSYCKSLSNKYDQVSRWIKQKESIKNPEMIDKDEVGQTLIPEDINYSGRWNQRISCLQGDWRWRSFVSLRQIRKEGKPTKKGSRQNAFISKKILLMKAHQKNLLRRVFKCKVSED